MLERSKIYEEGTILLKHIILLVLICTSALGYSQVINDNNVRMRDVPFLTSNVIKVLSKGDQIVIYRKTEFSQSIDNTNANWYLVQNKDNFGWVFGKYISNIELDKNEIYTSVYRKNINARSSYKALLPIDICYFDYDFVSKNFKSVSQSGNSEVVEEKVLRRMKVDVSEKIAAWFDPVDIRNGQMTAVYSDLIIRTPDSKAVLYPEKYNTKFYWDETSFIKLTQNGKYLVIDQGTWHIRGIYILDLLTYKIVASGSYVSSIRYTGNSNTIKYIIDPHVEYGYLNAVSYANKNSITQDVDGKNLKSVFDVDDNKKSDITFHFGNICTFNTETGSITRNGSILFYISYE